MIPIELIVVVAVVALMYSVIVTVCAISNDREWTERYVALATRGRRELQGAKRENAIRAEMEGKATPLYDRLKAEGFSPPATVMLIGVRKLTEAEVAYGLSLGADKVANE